MPSEYTPLTHEVRARAISAGAIDIIRRRDGVLASQAEVVAGEEFDRWLTQVKADAWDEGKRTGLVPNPYRKEQTDADER